uniref:EF-hand domain-containing protein n=1 Tax=Anopheles epiroticus TaxID=199890 RepID=A0A182PPY1_9DIPT
MNSKLEVCVNDEDTSIKNQACPYRVSSQSSVVDDAEEFTALEDPDGRIERIELGNEKPPSSSEWYRLQSNIYGAASFEIVAELLDTVQQNPAATVQLDFNRCGYTNLHVQIALDALMQTRPQCLARLDLSRNRLMNISLARYLGNVLMELQSIVHLSLSFNTLDDECVGVLGDALSNSGVRLLEAAHCAITDRGGSLLFSALIYNDCVEQMDLSWNHLDTASGQAIGRLLSTQNTLKELILTGNHLYQELQCTVPLLLGTISNETLDLLDLSWNGLRGEEVGRALLRAIPQSNLKRLKLQCNMLTPLEMSFIVKMVKKSETLVELWLGSNEFGDTVTVDLVRTFMRHQTLQLLSLGSFHFIPQTVAKLCRICKRRYPTKQIIYQGVLRANPPRPVDVQDMLLERCRFLAQKPKKAKLKRDLGHLMLQFGDAENAVLTREEFDLALKRFRLKLDRALLDALMDAFEVPKRLVDTGAMAVKYLTKHPTERPIVMPAKRKGKK